MHELHRILRITPGDGYTLELVFEGDERATIDLGPRVKSGGVWSALEDESVFRQVTVGEGGRYIEWPGDIDLCADALWLQAHGQLRDAI